MDKKYIELNSDKTPKHDYNTFHTSYDNLESAGLILDENTVVVDFDSNIHVAEYILSQFPTRAIKTKRGYHLYFKAPKNNIIKNTTHTITILGTPVDYKTGMGGKKQYAIIKLDGVEREVINPDITDYPELIPSLFPTNSKEDVISAVEGTRNDILYRHLLECSNILTNLKSIKILSEIIRSLMLNPLSEDEVNNIVNSVINHANSNLDLFSNDKNGNQTLDIFKLSGYLERKLSCVSYNDILYFRVGSKFSRSELELYREVKKMDLNLRKTQDKELYHQLSKTANVVDDEYLKINLNNGYCINNGIIEPSMEDFTPYNLNVAYNPTIYDENVDKFLNWFICGDKELRLLLEEIMGHILLTTGFPQHAFFFLANSGKNGKSTFFQMLNNFCGDLSESLALEQMGKEENLAVLRDKLLNCGDDIDDAIIPSSRNFKNLTSGNTISARELYQNPKKFRNKATLLFSCNEMPRFKDKSGGIERRVRVIPCNNIVKEVDLLIDSKLSTDNAKSYILNLALKGIERIKQNSGRMTEPKLSKDLTNKYIMESDSVKSFIEYYLVENNQVIHNIPQKNIYMQYVAFCESENVKPYSKNRFTNKLSDLGYTSKIAYVNGKSTRIYFKEN